MDDIQRDRMIRLNEIVNTLNVNNKQLAIELETNPGFISQLLNGHRKVTPQFAYRISKRYSQISAHWLITGEGEMAANKNQIKNELKIPDPGTLDPLVMEDEPPGYGSPPADAPCPAAPGEGVMERLQRDVADSRTEVDRLWTAYRAMLADMERQLGAYNTLAQELGVVRARVLLLEQELERLGGGVVGDEVPPG